MHRRYLTLSPARRVRSRRVLLDVARAPWPGKGWTTLLMQFLRRVRIRSFTLETPMAAYFFVDPRRRRNTYDAVRMKPVNRLRGPRHLTTTYRPVHNDNGDELDLQIETNKALSRDVPMHTANHTRRRHRLLHLLSPPPLDLWHTPVAWAFGLPRALRVSALQHDHQHTGRRKQVPRQFPLCRSPRQSSQPATQATARSTHVADCRNRGESTTVGRFFAPEAVSFSPPPPHAGEQTAEGGVDSANVRYVIPCELVGPSATAAACIIATRRAAWGMHFELPSTWVIPASTPYHESIAIACTACLDMHRR
ncbi:hypothetical protein PCL_00269 [Purpureocillium lilacinum]|uniref:Uncharacterized protein n=1 Tax=Purpureocillium lilacinum TaxID=33203 RepID=A0A2U3E6I2_PURLI|nr:hypothetical protein PCL_00269 [Purpureocillium lilacinum]